MKNLAFSVPKNLDDFVFVSQKYKLYNYICKQFPLPERICIKKNELETLEIIPNRPSFNSGTLTNLDKYNEKVLYKTFYPDDYNQVLKDIEYHKQSILNNVKEKTLECKKELELANINCVSCEPKSYTEVPVPVCGEILVGNKKIILQRFWYYWVVEGCEILSSKYVNQLYNNFGNVVRVDGHACGPNPNGKPVYVYHIDTQEGLNFFAKIVENFKNFTTFTTITDCVVSNNIPLLKELIDKGEDIKANNEYALIKAIKQNNSKVVKLLAIDERHDEFDKVFYLACKYGNLKIIKHLVEKGAIITPFFKYACKTCGLPVIKFLVEKGAIVSEDVLESVCLEKNIIIKYLKENMF